MTMEAGAAGHGDVAGGAHAVHAFRFHGDFDRTGRDGGHGIALHGEHGRVFLGELAPDEGRFALRFERGLKGVLLACVECQFSGYASDLRVAHPQGEALADRRVLFALVGRGRRDGDLAGADGGEGAILVDGGDLGVRSRPGHALHHVVRAAAFVQHRGGEVERVAHEQRLSFRRAADADGGGVVVYGEQAGGGNAVIRAARILLQAVVHGRDGERHLARGQGRHRVALHGGDVLVAFADVVPEEVLQLHVRRDGNGGEGMGLAHVQRQLLGDVVDAGHRVDDADEELALRSRAILAGSRDAHVVVPRRPCGVEQAEAALLIRKLDAEVVAVADVPAEALASGRQPAGFEVFQRVVAFQRQGEQLHIAAVAGSWRGQGR